MTIHPWWMLGGITSLIVGMLGLVLGIVQEMAEFVFLFTPFWFIAGIMMVAMAVRRRPGR